MNKTFYLIFSIFFTCGILKESHAQSSLLNANDSLIIQSIVDSIKIELKRQSNALESKISEESNSKNTKELKKENDELKKLIEKTTNEIKIEKNCVLILRQDSIKQHSDFLKLMSEKNKIDQEKSMVEKKIKEYVQSCLVRIKEEKEFRNSSLEELNKLFDLANNYAFLQNEKSSLSSLIQFKTIILAAENAYNVEYEEIQVKKCLDDLTKFSLVGDLSKLLPIKNENLANLQSYKDQLCTVKNTIEKVNKAYSKKEQSPFRLKTIEDERLFSRYVKFPNSFIYKAIDTSIKEATSIITITCPN